MSKNLSAHIFTRGKHASIRIQLCESFSERLRGFTFRKKLAFDEGLLLDEKKESRLGTSIHMFFVWTDLAVFWLDASYRIVDKTLAQSWHPYYASRHPARYVLEIHPQRLNDFEIGEVFNFEET